jgi:hypothetical protein
MVKTVAICGLGGMGVLSKSVYEDKSILCLVGSDDLSVLGL